MPRKGINTRISADLFDVRKMHKDQLKSALKGLHISDTDIDRVYSRKMKNINILKELGLQ